MTNVNWPYYISIGVCAMMAIAIISAYSALLPKDSAQNTKLLAIVGVFSFAASVVAYGIALYHFSHNPSYLIQFMLTLVMLVLLPATILAVSVSTITVSNLRDTLAAAK
jgi:uncharacterized membrane protein YjgN (DUF898 family)